MSPVVDDLPAWSIFSHTRIVLKGFVFWFKRLFTSFLSKERIWLKRFPLISAKKGVMVQRIADIIFVEQERVMAWRVPEKWAIFGQRALRHQSRWFQSITILGLVFLVIERVWQAWSYNKSWRIPNYQISKPYKNLSFFIAWFSKNSRKRVSKSGVLRPIAWAGVIKRFIWFFKNYAIRGTKVSYSNGFKMKGSVYRDGFITTVITISFKIQN